MDPGKAAGPYGKRGQRRDEMRVLENVTVPLRPSTRETREARPIKGIDDLQKILVIDIAGKKSSLVVLRHFTEKTTVEITPFRSGLRNARQMPADLP
jgi:hypothetical protein